MTYVVHGQKYKDETGLPGHTPNEGSDAINAKFAEMASLTDFDLLPGQEISTALTRALTELPPGSVIRLPPSDESYFWDTVVDWKADGMTLDARGATVLMTGGGKIRVGANGGKVLGGHWRHVPDAGKQSSGALFAIKNPALGQLPVHARNWSVRDAVLENVLVRFQKMGRTNVRLPLAYTYLAEDVNSVQTTLPVVDASRVQYALRVRVLTDTGTVAFRLVQGVDLVLNTVTIDSGLGSSAPEMRRVAGITVLTSAASAGTTLLHVESTALHIVGEYTFLALASGASFASRVVAMNTSTKTITIADQVPNGGALSGAAVQPCNNGVFPTGSDIASHSDITNCEICHCRANWAVEFGGTHGCRFSDNYIHDIVRYEDPDSPNYGIEHLPAVGEANPNYGEGIKVTAGADDVLIERNFYERIGRNAIDLYAGGGAIITRNHIKDQLKAGGIEAKWVSSDLNPPKAIIISHNMFEDSPGAAILAGAPNSIIMGNIIKNSGTGPNGGGGIYVNGAKNASVNGLVVSGFDEEIEEGIQNYTENVSLIGNRVMDCLGGYGIIVTESAGTTLVGNVCTGNYYNIVLNGAVKCSVVGNIARDHQAGGQDLRIVGNPALDCLHVFSGNTTTDMTGGVQFYDDDADFVVINGFGVEKFLAAGAQPTLSKWPVGVDVLNATDNKIFKRGMSSWIALN